jgi:hypothetical protein
VVDPETGKLVPPTRDQLMQYAPALMASANVGADGAGADDGGDGGDDMADEDARN